jgi:hypothetical protein
MDEFDFDDAELSYPEDELLARSQKFSPTKEPIYESRKASTASTQMIVEIHKHDDSPTNENAFSGFASASVSNKSKDIISPVTTGRHSDDEEYVEVFDKSRTRQDHEQESFSQSKSMKDIKQDMSVETKFVSFSAKANESSSSQRSMLEESELNSLNSDRSSRLSKSSRSFSSQSDVSSELSDPLSYSSSVVRKSPANHIEQDDDILSPLGRATAKEARQILDLDDDASMISISAMAPVQAQTTRTTMTTDSFAEGFYPTTLKPRPERVKAELTKDADTDDNDSLAGYKYVDPQAVTSNVEASSFKQAPAAVGASSSSAKQTSAEPSTMVAAGATVDDDYGFDVPTPAESAKVTAKITQKDQDESAKNSSNTPAKESLTISADNISSKNPSAKLSASTETAQVQVEESISAQDERRLDPISPMQDTSSSKKSTSDVSIRNDERSSVSFKANDQEKEVSIVDRHQLPVEVANGDDYGFALPSSKVVPQSPTKNHTDRISPSSSYSSKAEDNIASSSSYKLSSPKLSSDHANMTGTTSTTSDKPADQHSSKSVNLIAASPAIGDHYDCDESSNGDTIYLQKGNEDMSPSSSSKQRNATEMQARNDSAVIESKKGVIESDDYEETFEADEIIYPPSAVIEKDLEDPQYAKDFDREPQASSAQAGPRSLSLSSSAIIKSPTATGKSFLAQVIASSPPKASLEHDDYDFDGYESPARSPVKSSYNPPASIVTVTVAASEPQMTESQSVAPIAAGHDEAAIVKMADKVSEAEDTYEDDNYEDEFHEDEPSQQQSAPQPTAEADASENNRKPAIAIATSNEDEAEYEQDGFDEDQVTGGGYDDDEFEEPAVTLTDDLTGILDSSSSMPMILAPVKPRLKIKSIIGSPISMPNSRGSNGPKSSRPHRPMTTGHKPARSTANVAATTAAGASGSPAKQVGGGDLPFSLSHDDTTKLRLATNLKSPAKTTNDESDRFRWEMEATLAVNGFAERQLEEWKSNDAAIAMALANNFIVDDSSPLSPISRKGFGSPVGSSNRRPFDRTERNRQYIPNSYGPIVLAKMAESPTRFSQQTSQAQDDSVYQGSLLEDEYLNAENAFEVIDAPESLEQPTAADDVARALQDSSLESTEMESVNIDGSIMIIAPPALPEKLAPELRIRAYASVEEDSQIQKASSKPTKSTKPASRKPWLGKQLRSAASKGTQPMKTASNNNEADSSAATDLKKSLMDGSSDMDFILASLDDDSDDDAPRQPAAKTKPKAKTSSVIPSKNHQPSSSASIFSKNSQANESLGAASREEEIIRAYVGSSKEEYLRTTKPSVFYKKSRHQQRSKRVSSSADSKLPPLYSSSKPKNATASSSSTSASVTLPSIKPAPEEEMLSMPASRSIACTDVQSHSSVLLPEHDSEIIPMLRGRRLSALLDDLFPNPLIAKKALQILS